ncbi:MAG: hypothetical protein V7K60_24575 [Nostoc sp.]
MDICRYCLGRGFRTFNVVLEQQNQDCCKVSSDAWVGLRQRIFLKIKRIAGYWQRAIA